MRDVVVKLNIDSLLPKLLYRTITGVTVESFRVLIIVLWGNVSLVIELAVYID